MTACLIGACVVGGYIVGAAAMAFILGARRKPAPPPFVPPEGGRCRECIIIDALKKQHAELCRVWAELEKR